MQGQKGSTKVLIGTSTLMWCHVCREKVDVVFIQCTFNLDEEVKVFDLPIS